MILITMYLTGNTSKKIKKRYASKGTKFVL